MGLFDFKKKEVKKAVKVEDKVVSGKEGDLGIKILGSGCSKCHTLEKNTKEALAELGRDDEVFSVTDFVEIASYGVMSTPALVKDGKVLSYGKVLNTEEIKKLLEI